MIAGVAIKLADGRVLSLPKPARHSNLHREYNEKSRAKGWDFPWEGYDIEREEWGHGELGFVTDTGDFLSREEAAQHALECGQINAPRSGIFSEDLW